MANKMLTVQFPLGGVHRRLGFQKQAPFTSPDALNVLPDAHPSYRERGGSRRGLGPAFREVLGSASPIRMLAQCHVVELSGYSYWADDFLSDSLGTIWTAGAWSGVAGSLSVTDSHAYADTASLLRAVTRSSLSPGIDSAETYYVELFISPHNAEYFGDHYIYARMSGSDPTANGIIAKLTMTGTGGAFSGSLKTYAASVLKNTYNFTSGTDSFPAAGWFVLKIAGSVVTAYWRASSLLSQNISGDSVPSGTNIGFGLQATVASGRARADCFRVQYDKVGGNQQANRAMLLASANGELYEENVMGSMSVVTSALTLASDRHIEATERGQLLYIADWGDPKVEGDDGVVGTGTNRLDAASVSDWTAHGINQYDDVVVINNATGDITDGVYAINSITSGEIILSSQIATSGNGTCSYTIQRGPKVYEPATNTLILWTSTPGKGWVPFGQPHLCLWRDRMVMAGGADSPHNIYMSRQGDPNDWDYASLDVGAATAGNNALSGVVGQPITALIPHEDTCMYVGAYNELWVMKGDPSYGGQLERLSAVVGIVSGAAWCFTPAFEVVFLSHDGLYMLAGNCGSGGPQSLSREVVPADLLNVDANLVDVGMAWDQDLRGVHVYLTYKDSSPTKHWFFDWGTKSFWPWSLQTGHEPTAVLPYFSYHAYDNGILLGCRDGYIRRYHNSFLRDDGGSNISSYVFLGPFNLGGRDDLDGIIAELKATIATNSGSITWSIHVGDNAEEAFVAAAEYSGTWSTSGLTPSQNPRVRGSAGFLKLTGNGSRPWSVETIMMRVANVGKTRV